MSKKKAPPPPTEERPFNAAFAGLASLRDTLPQAERREPARAPAPKGPSRAVVRYERKGRGGKEATVVEQLVLSPRERAEWLLAMKHSLGCGGMLEGEALGVAVVVLGAAVAMAQGVPSALRWLEEKATPRWQQPSGEPG